MNGRINPIIRRCDYLPPNYRVESVELTFTLNEEKTRVVSRLRLQRAPQATTTTLTLLGRNLELLALRRDGSDLSQASYQRDDESLILTDCPAAFTLEIETAIYPQANTALEGLYLSSGRFCTQCEAEGFRRITYFPDRPDVLSRYSVTLIADRLRYPVLLSNGNLLESGELSDGLHFARWVDPFPKPSYLFALVAGDLALLDDRYVTRSGRSVALRIYTEAGNLDKCAHAMASLKEAMAWDEAVYGLEYDLDIYMIVAVGDFNMGAMENKGLNIFNARYVLACPETATDADYQSIREVIGHEYFHNWTGNRVTCRDWFQLSLKEGLTVFRDQNFSADLGSRAVKRIQDVRTLRASQFLEDGGPMAHPVRPESYEEINNFYTATVYNKGAEVIGMYRTLLGAELFHAGVTLYLSRHDGEAATINDFLRAMEEVSGRDLQQFSRWYSQAGTPQLTVTRRYDPQRSTLSLTLRQSLAPTPGQPEKELLHLPISIGLIGPQGEELPVRCAGEEPRPAGSRVIELRTAEATLELVDVPAGSLPSLLRSFSAPVRLHDDLHESERAFLLAHDSDSFCRWEAGQQLFTDLLLRHAAEADPALRVLPQTHASAYQRLLLDHHGDPALRALALTLPTVTTLLDLQLPADPPALHDARQGLRSALVESLPAELWSLYDGLQEHGPYAPEGAAVGRRSLKNTTLALLARCDRQGAAQACHTQFLTAGNMTDRLAALTILVDEDLPGHEDALAEFHQRWQHDPLVLDKWFTLQATAGSEAVFSDLLRLRAHPDFTLRNPNRVRSLLGAFAHSNPGRFHRSDGQGYDFIASEVLTLDPLNPQIATRLASSLSRWRTLAEPYGSAMHQALQRLARAGHLSRDLGELVSKSLKENL
ncbi:MAG: aminopeptidase N [Desulfuromonadales bacterium]|nr:aminopeptidase N [Desulfuromonadales bacterium]